MSAPPITRPVGAPDDWDEMSLYEQLSVLPEAERDTAVLELIRSGADLDSDEVRLRPKQKAIVDGDDWITTYAGGRGTGKTRVGGSWVNERAKKYPGCRISLIGRTVSDVRDTMINGESGIMAYADRDFRPTYYPSRRSIEWPNGSLGTTYSGDVPSQLRGPQAHFAWADELAAFPVRPDDSGTTMWDNILLSTRLGEHPQILVTTTPKRVEVIREIFHKSGISGSGYKLYQGGTWENRANLSAEYMEAIFSKYAGTHLERQELYGELIGDSPGALWRRADIVVRPLPKNTWEDPDNGVDDFVYVIGVDPAVKAGGDDTGIIVACSDTNPDIYKRRAWVVDDLTINGGPDEWAGIIAEAQTRYSTPMRPAIVVVEGNQGGDLLRMVLHQLNPAMPVAIVKAIASKAARAEPVVMAYRQHRVFHADDFPLLVEEQTGWEPDLARWSPGHLDACVWALSVLLVDPKPLYPYAPILVHSGAGSGSIGKAIAPFRRERGVHVGLAVAPWRR